MVPSLSCGRHKELGEGGRPRIAPYHTVRVVVHYSNFRWPMSAKVESRMGAVTWGLRPSPRFPSPLIKPDEPISGIRLSDWLHRKARDGAVRGRRWRHRTPSSR